MVSVWGFMCPPMINNNNTTLADLLENGEPTIYYEANSANIRRFWIESLTTLSG
ncbi:hypothetical protein VN1281_09550 [Helicobacter pylori]|nr:hypothetical protein VN1281_09550 [Helicobacter pylori]